MSGDGSSRDNVVVRVSADIREFVPTFLNNRAKEAARMKEALGRLDFDEIQAIAHKIRGSGGAYGFDAITEAGRRIEAAAKDGDRNEVERGLSFLADYLDRIKIVFE